MNLTSFNKILQVIRDKTGFDQLEARERLLVEIGLVFLLFFLLLQLVVLPYFTARQRLTRSITAKKAELAKLVDLQGQYRSLQGIRATGSAGQDAGVSLFPFIEEQAIRADVKKHILSMRPSTVETEDNAQKSSVELKLQTVPLGRLVTFLKLIEDTKQMVVVQNISIQDSRNENTVDVLMQIATVATR